MFEALFALESGQHKSGVLSDICVQFSVSTAVGISGRWDVARLEGVCFFT